MERLTIVGDSKMREGETLDNDDTIVHNCGNKIGYKTTNSAESIESIKISEIER